MRIPRFWEQTKTEVVLPSGRRIASTTWGWSEHSAEEARSKAVEAAQRIAERLTNAEDLPHQYGYDERLPREEIIDEFTSDDGQTQAIVTRNGYGSLILNTSALMFIDVDLPPKPTEIPLPAFLRKWLGKSPPVDRVAENLDRIRTAARNRSNLGFRVYRTRAGFRVMVASQAVRAESALAERLLDEFDADPLYRRMCKNQQCFRARLTPKAWRCRIEKPPTRFPYATPSAESAYRRWEKIYLQGIADYSTCDFLETIGIQRVDPNFAALVALHDKLTKSTSTDRLA